MNSTTGRKQILFMVVFCLCALSLQARGDENPDLYATPKIIAVQSRDYTLSDELTVQAGYLPLDSFNRYVIYGGTYTHFFTGYTAWEILNLNVASNISSGLEQTLQTSFGVATYPFNTLNYYGTSSFIYTPFSNKSLLFGSNLVRGETSFVLGAGMAKYDSGFVNLVDFGVIFRFFLSQHTSLKFDFREHIYFSTISTNNLLLVAGFAFNFGEPNVVAAAKDDDDD